MLLGVVFSLALLSAVNFILVIVAIGRIRALDEHPSHSDLVPSLGRKVSGFRAVATDGSIIEQADLSCGVRMVAFLSEACSACVQTADQLGAASRSGPDWVIFFARATNDSMSIVAPHQALTPESLQHLGTVVTLTDTDGVRPAFGGVPMFPTLMRLEDGIVVAASARLADVSQAHRTSL